MVGDFQQKSITVVHSFPHPFLRWWNFILLWKIRSSTFCIPYITKFRGSAEQVFCQCLLKVIIQCFHFMYNCWSQKMKFSRLYKMGSIYLSLMLVFQFLSFCFFEVVGFNNERRGANTLFYKPTPPIEFTTQS